MYVYSNRKCHKTNRSTYYLDDLQNVLYKSLYLKQNIIFWKKFRCNVAFMVMSTRRDDSISQKHYMSRLVAKSTKWHVRPAKTQISLDISPVWLESSLCAHWVAKDPRFLHADSGCPGWSESSLGANAILLVLSWGGSYVWSTYPPDISVFELFNAVCGLNI